MSSLPNFDSNSPTLASPYTRSCYPIDLSQITYFDVVFHAISDVRIIAHETPFRHQIDDLLQLRNALDRLDPSKVRTTRFYVPLWVSKMYTRPSLKPYRRESTCPPQEAVRRVAGFFLETCAAHDIGVVYDRTDEGEAPDELVEAFLEEVESES